MRAKWVARMLPLAVCWLVGAALWLARPSKSSNADAVETTARVHLDRTVRVDGVAYEVDAALVGEAVSVRAGRSPHGGRAEIWHHGRRLAQPRGIEVSKGAAAPVRAASIDAPVAPAARVASRDPAE